MVTIIMTPTATGGSGGNAMKKKDVRLLYHLCRATVTDHSFHTVAWLRMGPFPPDGSQQDHQQARLRQRTRQSQEYAMRK